MNTLIRTSRIGQLALQQKVPLRYELESLDSAVRPLFQSLGVVDKPYISQLLVYAARTT